MSHCSLDQPLHDHISEQYDVDPEGPGLVTVDTEFGLLGLSICADLMWESPIVKLVTDHDIDTLLLPLSWWDLFPHQLAHSNQDAWARGLQAMHVYQEIRK